MTFPTPEPGLTEKEWQEMMAGNRERDRQAHAHEVAIAEIYFCEFMELNEIELIEN